MSAIDTLAKWRRLLVQPKASLLAELREVDCTTEATDLDTSPVLQARLCLYYVGIDKELWPTILPAVTDLVTRTTEGMADFLFCLTLAREKADGSKPAILATIMDFIKVQQRHVSARSIQPSPNPELEAVGAVNSQENIPALSIAAVHAPHHIPAQAVTAVHAPDNMPAQPLAALRTPPRPSLLPVVRRNSWVELERDRLSRSGASRTLGSYLEISARMAVPDREY
ncbi:hypothetical protein GE09DRAFT_1057458 [Coniochaeta sp. 2T2.1]|nr:hypothetical protein GE09DRAFT_1057458 [Coniochaeta sp. 2T2.1]